MCMMLLPIIPLDYELSTPGDLPVPTSYRAARLLVRWHGVPLMVMQVPVANGVLSAADVARRLLSGHTPKLGRELARRALLDDGIDSRPEVADHSPESLPNKGLPTISVAICTRDRPDDMAKCLASIAGLRLAPLEVLVIDNAPSTEATARLVAEKFPEFRYVREDRPGLDHARNRAIVEARGEIVAYTDDDVMVDAGWTEALARVFGEDSAIGLVTGLIEPAELESPAQFLFERYGGFGRGCNRTYLQSRRGASLPWHLVGAGQLGAGANMAIRRTLFDEIGQFDPALDVGTPTLGGGDHEIFFRCLRSGMICLYEPTAIVRHRHRRSMEELSKLLYSYGHATRCFFEREALAFPENRPAIRKLTRWWWRHWAWERWRRSWWTPTWFPRELVVREIKGYVDGRGAYLRARRKIVKDEAARPDAFRIDPPVGGSELVLGGLVTVDLSRPLRPLDEGAGREVLEIVVQWKGRPLGRLRIQSRGAVIAPSRLADEIARSMWWQVLTLGDQDPSVSWAGHVFDFQRLLHRAMDRPRGLAEEIGVSIIVATCDRPSDLRRCLTSIFGLATRRRLQVIVVDNRPGRPGIRQVLQDFPTAELVEEGRPGSSYARNAGLAAAREEIVAMTDDDMVVAADWLERLIEPLARADVAAVSGHTLPASLESEAELNFEEYGGFGRGFQRREFDGEWFHRWKRRAVPTWQIGGTGNLAFRRELFHDPQIGAFEECLGSGVPAGVGEDTLWFYQILRRGHVICYEAEAVAWHHHRVSMAELKRQLMAYSKGHVAYHLITFSKFRDKRALVRLGYELPTSMASRVLNRLRGRSKYPWSLLAIEFAGMLLGPLALWQSIRHTRKYGLGCRADAVSES
ncbi:MAG: glycosyltransferase [Verrucomicrobia bacterium]|nr:MAG: glycosyltransferase [Verrucomicrobiota bacterium]TAE89188.1 MAG: glycosyltransferase [Verrucomicrobiota bacterium]TAF27936.1 MAG: glycosyltransferase [Verrucomicrobiota bacterium]TAF42785.1 MAG: glycosyltransferase [Verrucomicrobiota bacterium]